MSLIPPIAIGVGTMGRKGYQFSSQRIAGITAGIYFIVGILWILLSDRAALLLVTDVQRLTTLQHYKGWIFVALTTVLLHGIVTRLLRSVQQVNKRLVISEERFRLLSEASPDGMLVARDGCLVYANPAAAGLLGADSPKTLVGRKTVDFITPESLDAVMEVRSQLVELGQKTPLHEIQMRRLDGMLIPVQVTCVKSVWEGEPAVQLMLRDISEIRQAEKKLRRLSERLQLAIEGTGEGIWDWDIGRNEYTLSGGISHVLSKDAVLQGKGSDWTSLIHPDDRVRVSKEFKSTLSGSSPMFGCEYRLRMHDGNWKWVWVRGVVVDRDPDGKALMATGTLTDISVRKDSDEMVWRHANLDALTTLPNRRLFLERLDLELQKNRRTANRLALLFIDLDGFKQVNDMFGHDAGDLLLMEAGRRLKGGTRNTDLVARLGGDEFAVMLTELHDSDHLEIVCQHILASLAEPFQLSHEIGYVTGSIGISMSPLDALGAEELIRKADQAMYAAKRAGKNQFRYFTQEMDQRAHLRLQISNDLRYAMRNRQLSIYYQPVVDLSDGRIVKAEALLRWFHPTLGSIEPASFVPIAEESGLIQPIGNWVFREAAQYGQRCCDQLHMPFQISINKSPVQFMSAEGDGDWLAYLTVHGIPANLIAIEITEGVLLQAASTVTDMLHAYRKAGIQMALDDFGTGYASLSYLQKFQIDLVKIDQSFVQNMTVDPSSRTIAETIIVMAHKLGKRVVAEGIETKDQLQCLMAAGCDYGQGYLFSGPLPAEDFTRMLARSSCVRIH
ncbi:putative bifunctional diguanylate cyclase/phosphodiesterase [Noviherbaspirillum saxi]|uniref:EAL domain-containing protein n=1 Tax=Noviherbaspirillum saxi TaxID=2320863 RepID=A0A3A3FKQ7_9BURK|nr:EAL domain-containing protein [Noviherbaspirillum saxi]RJF95774.1 EAL domain-containing protein [Noviherbaspirillum saxi]